MSPRTRAGSTSGCDGAAIAGRAASSSASRSIAPAARCTSPHISVRAAAEVPTIAAYTKNWLSCPQLMSWPSTACAPSHST